MVEDVRLAVNGKRPLSWFGKGVGDPSSLFTGFGAIFSSEEILKNIRAIARAGGEH